MSFLVPRFDIQWPHSLLLPSLRCQTFEYSIFQQKPISDINLDWLLNIQPNFRNQCMHADTSFRRIEYAKSCCLSLFFWCMCFLFALSHGSCGWIGRKYAIFVAFFVCFKQCLLICLPACTVLLTLVWMDGTRICNSWSLIESADISALKLDVPQFWLDIHFWQFTSATFNLMINLHQQLFHFTLWGLCFKCCQKWVKSVESSVQYNFSQDLKSNTKFSAPSCCTWEWP